VDSSDDWDRDYGYAASKEDIGMLEDDQHRLRRLDALFAERVLGNTAYTSHEKKYTSSCHMCGNDTSMLPKYTRSLDAAWEGMVKIHLDYSETRKIWDDTADGSRPYGALIEGAKGSGYAKADHPAEALVLACLRAVGVGEEELK
jgi:hypothetical protein